MMAKVPIVGKCFIMCRRENILQAHVLDSAFSMDHPPDKVKPGGGLQQHGRGPISEAVEEESRAMEEAVRLVASPPQQYPLPSKKSQFSSVFRAYCAECGGS